ncbi:putative nuclease HARBI1 [Merluccius polli]|uniref:Putative nuclease HARBI1 n=1 Tax=Merluccius polli TaxID=89951 RepID=A0AA47MJZ7_MERPO|nr:putative nuclease HARBI1 [Merluccius polli]KAK0147272.1 putative nuclease HARBI1 [Merluccius polli]
MRETLSSPFQKERSLKPCVCDCGNIRCESNLLAGKLVRHIKPVRHIKEEFHRIAGGDCGRVRPATRHLSGFSWGPPTQDTGLPNVLGCIDGTHVPITAPSENEGDYVNRKSFHSINVQIICDAACIITNVEAKWPGSVHDSRIYRECRLSNRFARAKEAKALYKMHSNVSSIITGEFDGYLLGDHGYPCQPSLLTPYPDPEPGPQQHFNVAHCRTRARVEMTLGILKSRFQCLQKLRVTPERACDIIVACVVLHNIAIIRGEQHPAVQIIDPADDHPIPAPDVQDGRAARDLIARN